MVRHCPASCCFSGSSDDCETVDRERFQLNAQGGVHNSAPRAAAENKQEAMVRLLVENGADINAPGAELANALLLTAAWGRLVETKKSNELLSGIQIDSSNYY